jgi:hypothetical protein
MRSTRSPRTLVQQVRRRKSGHEDQGFILILVMVLSMIILSVAAVAIQGSVNNQSVTGSYVNGIQARLASESGINAATASIATSTSASALQCSLTSTSGTWSYATTVTYASSSGTAMACPLSAWPATAHVTSTGTSTKGGSVKMAEDLAITSASTPVTTLNPALNYAVFTPGGVKMSVNATIANGIGANGQEADVVTGDGIDCENGNVIGGNLYSYGTSELSIINNCSIGKGVYANSEIYLDGSPVVNGSVTSYGTGGINIDTTPTVGGNLTTTQGSITMTNSPTIDGNAYAYGTIKYNGTNVTAGSAGINQYIKGLVSYPNTSFAATTMPAEPAFPVIADPTQAQWATSGYTNYVVVSVNGTTVNGTPLTVTNNYGQTSAYTCSNYFAAQYNVGGVSSSPSEFAAMINGATTPTVIDASACPANTTVSPLNGSQTYSLQTNVALVINGISLNGTNTFTSSGSTAHDMSIIVPAPDTGQIYFTNNTSFSTTLSTFLYTEGTFSANSTPSINGQILAGTPNNTSTVDITNSFALTFSNAAATTIPGTTTTTNQGSGSPTVTALRRYLSR